MRSLVSLAITLAVVFMNVETVNMENVARGKPAFQSSVSWEGWPSRAVDGDTSTTYNDLSCTHTTRETHPWWFVDLQDEYRVQKIRITNRGDCCAERLHDVSVYVSHDNPMHLNPGPPELCAHIEGPISSGETRNVVCTQSFTGRYIIISMAGIDTLTLCEVEVDGVRVNMENVARGKPAFQSSVSSEGVPSRAVDGDTSTIYSDRSCTHTRREARPWWFVDLQDEYRVQQIGITNRGDCCAERLHDVSVYVTHDNPLYTTPAASKLCAQVNGVFASGETRSVVCRQSVTGRYVVISMPRYDILTLCEVEVHGVHVDMDNLARGKPAFQSSVSAEGVPSRAVDGDTSTIYSDRSCTNTTREAHPWWAVDLLDEYRVHAIRITNRGDCCADRLHDVSVHVLPLYPSHPFKPVASMLCALLIGPIPSGETRRVVCNADLVGRYVVISMAGNDILTLCEVQVHGVPASMVNVARGKPAFQSSESAGGMAYRAVDGITSSIYNDGSCTHTKKEANPWWCVDLFEEYNVQEIRITNRGDCCGERLHDFSVYALNYHPNQQMPVPSKLCAHVEGPFPPGETRHVICPADLNGRYVAIVLAGDEEILTLCEVEVYGKPANVKFG